MLSTIGRQASRIHSGGRSLIKALGPGLIAGAADDDPSGIATYSQAGAQFGLGMLWTAVFTLPLMVGIQMVSARIGCATGQGVAANLRRYYPKPLVLLVVGLLLIANVINLGADLGAMAAALRLVALFIILTAAVTLHANGITDVQTTEQAAQALRPIAGKWAFELFALGIVGTGLLAVPVLAGSAAYAVAEAFDWPTGLGLELRTGRGFYAVLAAAMLVGVGLDFNDVDPIRELFWSAVINGVIAVPIMGVMMLLAQRPEVMGPFQLSRRLRPWDGCPPASWLSQRWPCWRRASHREGSLQSAGAMALRRSCSNRRGIRSSAGIRRSHPASFIHWPA